MAGRGLGSSGEVVVVVVVVVVDIVGAVVGRGLGRVPVVSAQGDNDIGMHPLAMLVVAQYSRG